MIPRKSDLQTERGTREEKTMNKLGRRGGLGRNNLERGMNYNREGIKVEE